MVRQRLGFPIGAGISWSNHLVGARDYVGSCPVGDGDSLLCCPVGAGSPLSYCLVGAGCSYI
jgi:hypothetical protein